MSSISLSLFGYNMASSDTTRHIALEKAIAKHGVNPVIARLEYVRINPVYLSQTEADIEFVKSVDVDKDYANNNVANEYNSFMMKKMATLKGNDMNPKERLLECISSWKESKESKEVMVDNGIFIECMKTLNDKLYKATLDKDVVMINLIMTSMTNLIKSTL